MNCLFSFVFLLVCFAIQSKAERLYVNDKLVRLEPLTEEHINYLRALEDDGSIDFWTDVVTPFHYFVNNIFSCRKQNFLCFKFWCIFQ